MQEALRVYCDGGARGNPGPAAAAFVVVDERGKVIAKKGKFLGLATNNQAEYEAVVLALTWLKENLTGDQKEVIIFLDSELLVNQLSGKFKVKNKKLQALIVRTINILKELPVKVSYRAIPRSYNRLADFLVNQILDAKIK